MHSNKYSVNVTYAIDRMNNYFRDNYIIQGRNSHNNQIEIQNTEQKFTYNTDDTISFIPYTSFAQIRKVKCY